MPNEPEEILTAKVIRARLGGISKQFFYQLCQRIGARPLPFAKNHKRYKWSQFSHLIK